MLVCVLTFAGYECVSPCRVFRFNLTDSRLNSTPPVKCLSVCLEHILAGVVLRQKVRLFPCTTPAAPNLIKAHK